MTISRKSRILSIGAAAAALTVGLVLAYQPMASAVVPAGSGAPSASATSPGAPAVTVTPSTNLLDGSTVQAAVTGFPPNQTVFVDQCALPLPGVLVCTSDGTPDVQFTTSGSGAGSTPVAVRQTFPGFQVGGSFWGSINCSIIDCIIGIGNHFFGSASSPLSFAPVPPRTATVTPSTNIVDGSAVRVSAANFGAKQTLFVDVCALPQPGVLVCASNGTPETKFTTDDSGAGSTTLTVNRSFTGYQVGGSAWGQINCSIIECIIGIGNHLLGAESLPISFK